MLRRRWKHRHRARRLILGLLQAFQFSSSPEINCSASGFQPGGMASCTLIGRTVRSPRLLPDASSLAIDPEDR